MKTWLVVAAGLLAAGTVWAAAPKNAKTGKVKVATPGLIVRLKTPDSGSRPYLAGKPMKSQGDYDGIPLPVDKEVPMPEGKYEVSSVTVAEQGKDENGAVAVWTLTAEKELGKLRDVTVTADETVVLEGGGPFKIKIDIKFWPDGLDQRSSERGDGASIRIRYVGKSGEEYHPRLMKGRNVSGSMPQVRIYNQENTLVYSSAYSFMADKDVASVPGQPAAFGGVGWRMPPGFMGKFRIQVIPNAGPFQFEKQAEDDWKEFPRPGK
jgi:hypothetical protein